MDGMVTLPFSCGFRSGRCAFLKRTVLISLIQRMCNIYANVPSFGGRQDWESSRLLQLAERLAWAGAGSAKSSLEVVEHTSDVHTVTERLVKDGAPSLVQIFM